MSMKATTVLKVMLIVLLLASSVGVVRAQITINEICPSNVDVKYDPQFFNFSPWVELYNGGNASVNIGGYFLSDNSAEKTRWTIPSGTSIPAKGYLLIWCDNKNSGLHTNFSLDSDGEEIILSTPASVTVDQKVFPVQLTNIAYGRIANGGPTWGYLIVPTPGAANNPATATQALEKPNFSIKAGRYASARQISLSHPSTGVEIRYTTNGSEPTSTSQLYTAPIPVNQTGSVKARAFLSGYLPSPTETHSYFINEHATTLPSISITTQPEYLWDNMIGIYTNGTNGIAGNCQALPMNWNQDWERHAVFEYFDAAGSSVINQEVDIRIGGACSRNQASKVIRA